jgi:hypothetical protein
MLMYSQEEIQQAHSKWWCLKKRLMTCENLLNDYINEYQQSLENDLDDNEKTKIKQAKDSLEELYVLFKELESSSWNKIGKSV